MFGSLGSAVEWKSPHNSLRNLLKKNPRRGLKFSYCACNFINFHEAKLEMSALIQAIREGRTEDSFKPFSSCSAHELNFVDHASHIFLSFFRPFLDFFSLSFSDCIQEGDTALIWACDRSQKELALKLLHDPRLTSACLNQVDKVCSLLLFSLVRSSFSRRSIVCRMATQR